MKNERMYSSILMVFGISMRKIQDLIIVMKQ